MALKTTLKQLLARGIHYSPALKYLQAQAPSWRILMYHRISTPEFCGYPLQPGMYVRPENFAMQMNYLAAHCNVIPLDELAELITEGKQIPAATVAITFDDGWRDNYLHAFPVLKSYKLPATIFLATSFINSSKTFWSDLLPRAVTTLYKSKKDYSQIETHVNNAFPPEIIKPIQSTLEAKENDFAHSLDHMVGAMKFFNEAQRQSLAMDLAEIAELDEEQAFLSWQECLEMQEHGVTFGSHTHAHCPLSELDDVAIREEMRTSFSKLKEHQIVPAKTFCYPEGKYSPQTQAVLSEIGIPFALSIEKNAQLDEKPALLGRVGIHDDIANTSELFTSRVWANQIF